MKKVIYTKRQNDETIIMDIQGVEYEGTPDMRVFEKEIRCMLGEDSEVSALRVDFVKEPIAVSTGNKAKDSALVLVPMHIDYFLKDIVELTESDLTDTQCMAIDRVFDNQQYYAKKILREIA